MTALPVAPARAGQPAAGLVQEHAAHRLARLAPLHDGLTFLEAIKNGDLPDPPIAELLGFEIRAVERGHVVFAMPPTEQHYNPIGTVHGGVIATLLDTAMGCAVQTKLPKGTGYTTLDISVRYLRPVTTQTHTVLAIGTALHVGRRTAIAEAQLRAEDTDMLLATGTSTLLVMR